MSESDRPPARPHTTGGRITSTPTIGQSDGIPDISAHVQLRHAAEPTYGDSHYEAIPRTACTARALRLHEAITQRCNTGPEGGG